MGVVLRASIPLNGILPRLAIGAGRTVEVRNVQGSTHRVLKEILQYTRLSGCVRFFIVVKPQAPGASRWRKNDA
jgi:hypothetical protein